MNRNHPKPPSHGRVPVFVALLGVLAILWLASASSASAASSFEQVTHFAGSTQAPKEPGVFPEEVQLAGVGGMAVNYTGAGGVPAGTLYAMSAMEGGLWVAMYEPSAEGMEFREAWRVEGASGSYPRCGVKAGLSACNARVAAPAGFGDVEVDEATGNVYAFNGLLTTEGAKAVVEYSADGALEITRFGELAAGSQTIAESPAKLHTSFQSGALAVGGGGRVYVFDERRGGEQYRRLAVFEPEGGDREHYKYAGEVAAGLQGEGKLPSRPVADASGNVYVAEETYIQEYAPETPTSYHSHHSTPICAFEYPKGGITAITVNQVSGEVFFFNEKSPKRIHRLGPCNPGTGKFGVELQEIPWSPEREPLWGLAFDPVRKFSAGREAGILYGGSPGPGKETGQSSLGYIFAPSDENPPSVGAESVGKVTASSAQLRALVDPKNFETEYAFQYESEAAYLANEPDERQSLSVSATGGMFRVGFGGQSSGGVAKVGLTAGSRTASSLVVAEGTATTSDKSNVLTSVTTTFGGFEVGQPLTGAGISVGTRITAIEAGKITLSAPAGASASGVAISSAGPAPLEVGEVVQGAGIPAGTKITAVEAGQATLSQPATATASGVTIDGGIAFDASAAQVRRVLEAMSSVGPRNVAVSGGPGDEAGSTPYVVTFTGQFGNTDLPEMSADASQLTGAGAAATVSTLHDGGGGFAGAAVLEAPVGGGTLKGGVGPTGVGVTLTGLSPDSAYRYRAVAQSECAPSEPGKACEVAGQTKAFRTYPVETRGPADSRAFELVSPMQKQGGQVLPAQPNIASCTLVICKPGSLYQHFPMQSAPSGDAVAYEGTSFSEGGAAIENEYIARRNPQAGWQSIYPTPSLLQSGFDRGYTGVSSALTRGVIRQLSPTLSSGAPAEYPNLYTQSFSDPLALTPLVGAAPKNRLPTGSGSFEVAYTGASADGTRIFFAANDALTEEVPNIAPEAKDGGATKFNLYEWHEGQLALVNVKPGNTETEAGASFGVGSAQPISEKGDRAFFSDETGQVYVRIDGRETRKIEDPGKFLTAAADGSKVLLADGCLYDLEEEECEDLTAEIGGFQGILGQSEDLSHLYFVDTAVLTGEEENEAGQVAAEGQNNLYAWSAGASRFVATLQPQDNSGVGNGGGISDWTASPANRTAQASPHGRFAAFLSRAPLTGYQNTGPCEEDSGQGVFFQTPCPEAFIYDSATGKLTCASCNPSGAAPLGWAVLRRIQGVPSYLPQPRYLSDNGRLFFDSEDSLSPADSNVGVEDVYEWEPQGVGSCGRAGGCVALISAGREAFDSNFLATDPSGENAFFTSRDRLVGTDTDVLIDLYDARVGGGFVEALPPSPCQGEGCQPSPPPPPEPPPPSSTFDGPGNPASPKSCKKNQVKKKGKCVKKPHHKKATKAKHGKGGR
jgi:hypothetical protein